MNDVFNTIFLGTKSMLKRKLLFISLMGIAFILSGCSESESTEIYYGSMLNSGVKSATLTISQDSAQFDFKYVEHPDEQLIGLIQRNEDPTVFHIQLNDEKVSGLLEFIQINLPFGPYLCSDCPDHTKGFVRANMPVTWGKE